jgi:hypothetical protein
MGKGAVSDVIANDIGGLVSEYRKRRYSDDELSEALRSLAHLIFTRSFVGSIDVHPDEPRLEGVEDPIVIYVNPTCDECQRVVSIIIKARRACDGDFPSVVFRLLPANEPRSIEATTALTAARRHSRDDYVSLVLDFLNILPDSDRSIDSLIPPTFGVQHFADLPEYAESERFIRATLQSDLARERTAPIVIFHDRILERDRTFTIPFDPLRDDQSFNAVINAIRVLDSEKVKQEVK